MTALNIGTTPPGFMVPAESWRRMVGGEIAALMRRIDFDGTQACDGDPAYTDSELWTDDEIGRMIGVCETQCPFFIQCRDWAIAHERWNFQGGMTERERARYRKAQRIQVVDRYASELYGLIPTTSKETA